jgi:hypothetical protein
MANTKALENTFSLLVSLHHQVNETHKKIMDENSDVYFRQNINFFSKAFIVLLCAYLEGYLKDACQELVEKVNRQLKSVTIPHNLAVWSIQGEKYKPNEFKYQSFEIAISKDDLDNIVSANVDVTIKTYQRFGIDLTVCTPFCESKDKIGSIVAKRNNVVHHNDDASDLSLVDLMGYIAVFKDYIKVIDDEISKSFD